MIYRSEAWLAAVRSLPYCVLCGRPGVQAAHRNEGKGTAVKVDDCACAAICPDCHREIDHGPQLMRDARRTLMDRAIVLTVIELARRGQLAALATPACHVISAARTKVQAKRQSKGNTASPTKMLPRTPL